MQSVSGSLLGPGKVTHFVHLSKSPEYVSPASKDLVFGSQGYPDIFGHHPALPCHIQDSVCGSPGYAVVVSVATHLIPPII